MISIRLSKMLALCFVFGANLIIVSLVFSLSPQTKPPNAFPNKNLATSSVYNDEFNSFDLNPTWYWQNENPANWSLSESPGKLQIISKEGCIPDAENVLLRQTDLQDYIVTTKVEFNPTHNFQQAGLIFYGDPFNRIKLSVVYNDEQFSGQIVEFVLVVDGVRTHRYQVAADLTQAVYLKIEKQGNNYTGFYSFDNINFNAFPTANASQSSLSEIGLYTNNSCYSNVPDIPAKFDFYRLTESCEVPFFWQRDPNGIKDHLLRGTCGANYTLGEGGCTLTSATMLFRFYGANLTSDNTEMTPSNLSDCMGVKACPFNWPAGAACSNGNATSPRRDKSFSYSQLDDELNKYNRPVILQMCRPKGNCNTDGPQTHWVLVTGGQGNDPANYTIWDPWFECGQNMRLNSRSETWDFVGIAVYDGTPTCRFSTEVPVCAQSISPVGVPAASLITNMRNNTATPLSLTGSSDITGAATLYRTTNMTMTVHLSAESSVGNVTEMLIWSDTLSNTTWQPFESFVWLPLSDFVYVQFRDDMGNVSDIISDTPNPSGPPAAEDPNRTFLPLTTK